MTYKEAIDFIEGSKRYGWVLGLGTITELTKRLNNPQDKLKIIHIAGTNGKGSTAAFITSILCAAKYRVGRFVSPAVFSYREILQISECKYNSPAADYDIDKQLVTSYISEEEIQEIVKRIKLVCEDMVKDGFPHPTTFEIETAMAFLYMEQKQVDFFVLETGMGGRLDATNVISRPICSVITSISFDHMQYLGDTLYKIATEKAGIIKPDSTVVTLRQNKEVLSALQRKADELNSEFVVADCDKAENIRYHINYTEFTYPHNEKSCTYRICLLGKHQIQNAILAIETARIVRKSGYEIKEEAIKEGLQIATWPGRFQQISKTPDIFIDGAHNEEAALRLRDSVETYFNNRRLIFMIGVFADKDYQNILHIMAPLADLIITLTPDNPRALPSDKLALDAKKYCCKVIDGENVRRALEIACNEAEENDVILAFGSLSFLGELTDALNSRNNKG